MRGAAIAPFHPVVQILVGDCTERLVVKAGQSQRFPQIFLKILNCFQLFSQSRLALTAGSLEKLLKSAIHQGADFATHHHTGPNDEPRTTAVARLSNTGDPVALDPRAFRDGLNGKTLGAGLGQVIFKTQYFRACVFEKHG